MVQTLYIQNFFLQLSLAVLHSKNLRYMPYTFKIISTVKNSKTKLAPRYNMI